MFIISHFTTKLNINHLNFVYLSPHITLSTLLILAVRRAHVIHKPGIWPGSPRVSSSSVVTAPDWCAEGHKFDSCRALRFLCPTLVA